MSCQSTRPVSPAGAEAGGLASPPSPEWCEEHGESLCLFCLEDLEPSCKQCAAASHTGHKVYPLTEAATDCKAEAKLTEEHITKEFESLHQFLREEEAARLLALRETQEEKKRETDELIGRVNQKTTSLEEKIHLIEEEPDAGGDGVEFLKVGDTNNWTIGVAAQSASRRVEFEACPEAGLWSVSLRDGQYRVLTSPSEARKLNSSHHLGRVRLRLDWDGEGTLEFIDTETDSHLFTFRHRFTEKVYPYFESMLPCGRLAVLAQRVNVSAGSDYVPVEDAAVTEEGQVKNNGSYTDNNTTVTNSNGKMSECGRMTGDQNSAICDSVREEKKSKPLGKEELVQTKLAVRKHQVQCDLPRLTEQSAKHQQQ